MKTTFRYVIYVLSLVFALNVSAQSKSSRSTSVRKTQQNSDMRLDKTDQPFNYNESRGEIAKGCNCPTYQTSAAYFRLKYGVSAFSDTYVTSAPSYGIDFGSVGDSGFGLLGLFKINEMKEKYVGNLFMYQELKSNFIGVGPSYSFLNKWMNLVFSLGLGKIDYNITYDSNDSVRSTILTISKDRLGAFTQIDADIHFGTSFFFNVGLFIESTFGPKEKVSFSSYSAGLGFIF